MKSCSESQHDSEKDDDGRVAAAGGHKAKHQGSRQKARNRAAQQRSEERRVGKGVDQRRTRDKNEQRKTGSIPRDSINRRRWSISGEQQSIAKCRTGQSRS